MQSVKLEFAGLFVRWCAVSMRYASSPPALVRGVPPVRRPGGGGSTSSACLSQESVKNRTGNTERSFYFTFCCREFALPPIPVCATLITPLVNEGGKASNHPRTIERYRAGQGKNDNTYLAHDLAARPAGQIPIYRTAFFR